MINYNDNSRQMKAIRSRLDSISEHIGAFADSPIEIIPEDKGYLESKLQRTQPQDPEDGYEEKLEMEGATILDHHPILNHLLSSIKY
jgi:hypothetical protein